MSNTAITVFVLSLFSIAMISIFSYAPYGSYPKNLAVISSFFVFLSFYKALIEKKIEFLYLSPYILMTWLYFQSPFLLEERTYYINRVIKYEYIDEIATYTCLAVVIIFIGYSLFLRNHPKPLVSREFQFDDFTLRKLSLYFCYLAVFYRIGRFFLPAVFDSLSNLIQILYFAPSIGFALYILYLLRTKSRPNFQLYHVAIISILILEFLLRLSTTLMAQVGVLFMGVFIVYYRERGRLPIIWLLVIGLIGIPLYQSRKFFRYEMYKSQEVTFSPVEFGFSVIEKVFIDDIQEPKRRNDDLDDFLRSEEESQQNRFENLSFISHVVWQHKTDKKKFLQGETFYWLPLSPIPRIIFPAKPVNEMGSTKSTEYGLRAKNSASSINFPMLVEAYINFDFLGMLVLAFLFGISFKWFVMKFGAGLGDLNLIMIINASKQFTHAEGNITLVFGALIQVYIFWWVVVNVFNNQKLKA